MSFKQGVENVLAEINYWSEAPLWDPDSISKATETWFRHLAL